MKSSIKLFLLLAIIFQSFFVPRASAQLSQIATQSLSNTSFSVSWYTPTPQGSLVIYGTSPSYGLSASDLTPTTNHRLTISNVAQGKLVYFHIVQLPVDIKRENLALYSTHLPGAVAPVTTAAAFTLSRTLTIGSTGEDVRALQKFLNSQGITVSISGPGSPGYETAYYGPATAAAVSRFQLTYRADILAPSGLSSGTGTAGPATRSKINQLAAARAAAGPVATTGTQPTRPAGATGYTPPPSPGAVTPPYTPPAAPSPSPVSPSPVTPPPPAAPVSGSGSCFDGSDNDSDGRTDMGSGTLATADFDCYGANGREASSDPVYTILKPSSDTKIYYVSNTDGNDNNNGLTPTAAFKTITKGISMLRTGFPDWVLLKRGDTWTGKGALILTLSGRSASEPIVIGSYGTSPARPKIHDKHFFTASGASNFVMAGLHFERFDKSSSDNGFGVHIADTSSNITFDDVYFRGYGVGFNVGSVDNLKILNSVIVDNGQHGILGGGLTRMVLKGNIIDFNGWDPSAGVPSNTFNHNIYLYHAGNPMTIANNIIARGSSHGVTFAGGTVENNLMIQNAIGMFTDRDNTVIRRNVFNDGRDIDGGNARGYGIWASFKKGEVSDNTFINQVTGTGGPAIYFDNGLTGLTVRGNTVYNWCGKYGCDPFHGTAIGLTEPFSGTNSVSDNTLVQPSAQLFHSGANPFSTFNFSGNHYYSGGDASRWFGIPGSISKTGWAGASGEDDATYTQPIFRDQNRSAGSYNASLGGGNSIAAFLTEARKLSKLSAPTSRYTAPVVNDWIRTGFEVTGYEPAGQSTTHTITASAGSGGTITPSGSVSVAGGFSQQFTITPNSGFQVVSVTADGVNQGALASYTFSNVTAAHTISATFSSAQGSSKFVAGDRIQVTSNVNVRATPSTAGTLLGTQFASAVGTVISGPVVANGFSWYNINYDIGVDGYSVEDFLIKSSTAAPTAPAAPSGVNATAVSSGQINVSWNTVSGAASYKVERSTSQTTGFTQILNTSVSSINDTGLSANTTYYYRVRASNTAGDSGYSSTDSATTLSVVAGGSGSSGPASCSDGVDNDSDGSVDMNDFSCSGPNMREGSSTPYTSFTPSSDSRIIYVSTSGSDSNDGLTTATALRTPQVALSRLRSGFPDWVLFKRGDTWTTNDPNEMGLRIAGSGRSASEPLLVGTYGTATSRPSLVNYYFGSFAANSNWALVGIKLTRANRSSSENTFGIYINQPSGSNILLEDLYIADYNDNMWLGSSPSAFQNFKIRYSVIVDGWAQGILAGNIADWLLEGNVIDYNGWQDGVAGREASAFNHNVYGYYGGHPTTVRNNIFGRGSSHGITIHSGLVEDNLFVQNAIGIFAQHYLTVRRNVFNDGHDIAADSLRGYGIWTDTKEGGEYYDNFFVHQVTGGGGAAIFTDTGSNNLSIHDNVFYNWCSSSGCHPFYGGPIYVGGNIVAPNSIKDNVTSQFQGIMLGLGKDPEGAIAFSGNHYYLSNPNEDRWFGVGDGSVSRANWPTFSGETNATFGKINFAAPTRTVATYNASLGGGNSYDAFLTKARLLSKATYDSRYVAKDVNEWVADGYEVTSIDAAPASPSPAPSPSPNPSPSPAPSPSPNPSPSPAPTPTPPSGGVAPTSGLIHHYQFNGSATDSAGSANGTLVGSPSYVSGYAGSALQLSGSNYVSLQNSLNQGTGSYTFSTWINPSSISGCDNSGDGCNIINQYENAEGDFYFGIGSSGAVTAVFRESGESVGRRVDLNAANAITIVPGSWYHVAVTRTGTTYAVYINNVAQPLSTFQVGSGAGGTRIGTTLPGNSTYSFRGLIDEVRIYNRALSSSEVSQLYNASVASQSQTSALANILEQLRVLLEKLRAN